MPIFKQNDFVMAYDDKGTGIPILFIHGYPLNRQMWYPQKEGLADICRLIIPDLRGHGDSSPVTGIYSMELLADDCHALLKYLKIIETVYICGLSMGGYIAMAFCRKYPQLVKGLILVSTRAGVDSPEAKINREKAANLLLSEGLDPICDMMLNKLLAPETYKKNPILVNQIRKIIMKTSPAGIRGALLGMKERSESFKMLSSFSKPSLIIHGLEDQLIPITEAELMRQHLQKAKLVMLPGAGHLPNLEQPHLFNQELRLLILNQE